MAANLVRRYRPDEAHHLLNLSFAQFQADRAVVRLEARIERQGQRLARLRGGGAVRARRRRGVPAPAGRGGGDAAHGRDVAWTGSPPALARLNPGDVVVVDGTRLAVLSVAIRKGNPRLQVVDERSAATAPCTARISDDAPRGRRQRGAAGAVQPEQPRPSSSRWPRRCDGPDSARPRRLPIADGGPDPRRRGDAGRGAATRWPTARTVTRTSAPRCRPTGSNASWRTSAARCGAGPSRSPGGSTASCACSRRGATSTAGRSPRPARCWPGPTTRPICSWPRP